MISIEFFDEKVFLKLLRSKNKLVEQKNKITPLEFHVGVLSEAQRATHAKTAPPAEDTAALFNEFR